jgi:glycosyltransferase involved in cell wall biosynthesis
LKIKIICDIDDVYYEKAKTRNQNETNFFKNLKIRILHYIGSKKAGKIFKRIDVPIVVKEADRSYKGLSASKYLPNLPFGYFLNDTQTDFNPANENVFQEHFGFIGKLSYRPNYEGLLYFITKVWKVLMQNNFKGKFIIAGSGEMPLELKKAIDATTNIELLGFVATPEIFWNKVDVLVVPVSEGGGSNIKVAEAFIHGKKVIAHPFSARGYEHFIQLNGLFLPKNEEEWRSGVENFSSKNTIQSDKLKEEAMEIFDLKKWNQELLEICKL